MHAGTQVLDLQQVAWGVLQLQGKPGRRMKLSDILDWMRVCVKLMRRAVDL